MSTLGAATAVFGVGAGALAAYVIVVTVMDFEFAFSWGSSLGSALGGLALTVGLGMASVWRILGMAARDGDARKIGPNLALARN